MVPVVLIVEGNPGKIVLVAFTAELELTKELELPDPPPIIPENT